MVDQTSAPIARLLAAVVATQEAFTVAAGAAGSTGFATEFAQRAEYQERIVSHLRGGRAPVGMASNALRRVPVMRIEALDADQSRVLFDECLRMLDAATLEFCRSYGPGVAVVLTDAIQAARPIDTTRHNGIHTGAAQDEPELASGYLTQAS